MAEKKGARGGQRKSPLAAVPSDTSTHRTSTTEQARARYYGEKLLAYAASGTSVEQGARILEIPITAARRYFDAALVTVQGLTDEEKRELVRLDLEALRMLIQAHMPHALRGKIGSAQVVLASMRERATRLGLDEALQVSIRNNAIGDAVEDVITIIEAAAPVDLPPLPQLPPLPGETEAG